MTVKVKFFAYFRELFGGRERSFDLPPGMVFGRFLDLLGDTPARRAELYDSPAVEGSPGGEAAALPPGAPGLRLKPHLVVMINGMNPAASSDIFGVELRDGDVVAVFPLMGGG